MVLMNSCADLKSSLFNPVQVEKYLYDEYQNGEFKIHDKYDILAGEINEFSVTSDFEGDLAEIYGAYIGDINTIDQDTVILYCHGNSTHMDIYHQRVKMLYHIGGKSNVGVLNYDYRGFGLSEGITTEGSMVADITAMINWLKDQGIAEEKLFIYGFSLGSIPAIAACKDNLGLRPTRLLLEAPIGSIDAMARDGSGLYLPGSYFADLQTDNIAAIKAVDQPLYWIHGEKDDFLARLTHGQPIFDKHNGSFKVKEIVPTGNHGDTPFEFGIEAYIESVTAFMREEE